MDDAAGSGGFGAGFGAGFVGFVDFLRETFPARSELASLEFEDAALRDEVGVVLTVRLVCWDEDDGVRSIRDVKEQEVWVCELDALEDPRMVACVTGWHMALEQIFAQEDLSWLETSMPADLLRPFAELLRLKRPRTADDFAEALLASRQRLGAFLRP